MEIYSEKGHLTGMGGFAKTGESVTKEKEWTFFYDGTKGTKIQAKGLFKNNKQEGPWINYYESGNKKGEAVYADGKLNGAVITYDEKGLKTSEIYYINNKMAGQNRPSSRVLQYHRRSSTISMERKTASARNSSMMENLRFPPTTRMMNWMEPGTRTIPTATRR